MIFYIFSSIFHNLSLYETRALMCFLPRTNNGVCPVTRTRRPKTKEHTAFTAPKQIITLPMFCIPNTQLTYD